MKMFEDKPIEKRQVEPMIADNSIFMKRNLMKSVLRSDQVRNAFERWLLSFQGGITKQHFTKQLHRLSFNDEEALEQLENALGKRVIPMPKAKPLPKLHRPLVEQMLDDLYVAVSGRGFKTAVASAIKELKTCGTVYVLEIEELILQFKSYKDKGTSPQIIDKAIDCDFLFIVNLEMPIHLDWHINEAIERIGRAREAKQKPIISTWNRYNDCKEFFKRFHIYSV